MKKIISTAPVLEHFYRQKRVFLYENGDVYLNK